ncbi:MAG: hypothetical protein AAF329_22140 [Cyanobacteria bacterium P01_A01_bin.17]
MPSTLTDTKNRLDTHLEPVAQILVSATTPPLLLGVLVQQQCGQWLEELGQLSESFFQGRRLPNLPFPEADPPEAEELV